MPWDEYFMQLRCSDAYSAKRSYLYRFCLKKLLCTKHHKALSHFIVHSYSVVKVFPVWFYTSYSTSSNLIKSILSKIVPTDHTIRPINRRTNSRQTCEEESEMSLFLQLYFERILRVPGRCTPALRPFPQPRFRSEERAPRVKQV